MAAFRRNNQFVGCIEVRLHCAHLAKKADEGKDYAQKKARELRERADELIERSKEVAVRKKDSISAAVEAGREAYLRESKA